MKRPREQDMLDGPGTEPDYAGPMPADVAARLEADGEEIRIAHEAREEEELPAENARPGGTRRG